MPLPHTMRPRGYSLPLVMLLIAVLATASVAAVLVTVSSSDATGAALNRRQAFYACDGIARAAVVASRPYMRTANPPTPAGIQTAVCGSTTSCPNAPTYAPAGFTIDTLTLDTDNTSAVAPLPNGPFAGMNARQTKVKVTVEATKNATNARCRVDESTLLGEVALFQFFVFSDGFMDLYNGPAMDIDGRVHVNGDFSAANCGGALTITKITASGRIRHAGPSGGRASLCNGASFSIKDASSGTYRTIADTGESGCVGCSPAPGAGNWRAYALSRWGGNVQDVEHAVPRLTMPFVGSAAVPDGLNADGGGVDNSQTMRALIDPVRAADPAGVSNQKLAAKADIRIINGVWYKKIPATPALIGTPIWSDHPGDYTLGVDPEGIEQTGTRVGQAQLATDLAWAAVPRRYSYYETDALATSKQLTEAGSGAGAATTSVISYGALTCAAGVCEPGFMKGASGNALPGAIGTPASYCRNGADGMLPAKSTDATSAGTCNDATNTTRGLNFIQGTRSGFQDWRVRAFTSQSQGRILPVNFDVSAFAAALTDNTPGELGSYLTSASFNGVVFIANTWAGEMNNFNTAASAAAPPSLWPRVDQAGATAGQPPTSHSGGVGSAAGNVAIDKLPYPLCSGNLGTLEYTNPTNIVAGTRHKIPPCTFGAGAAGDEDDPTSRPNAVRVINASNIDHTIFPRGLSIVTNGPVYIEGNTNTSSCTDPPTCNTMKPSMSAGGDWRPLMIAGDAMTLLSNNWTDANAHWGAGANFGAVRTPTFTSYVVAAIAGNVETGATNWGGGINNFPRFIEKWSASGGGGAPEVTAHIVGSLVIAFRSAYQRQPWDTATGSTDIYNPPLRLWEYDTNLQLPADQPPETPQFFVQAIQAWQRD